MNDRQLTAIELTNISINIPAAIQMFGTLQPDPMLVANMPNLVSIGKSIRELEFVKNGEKIPGTTNRITPLMFYAIANITDERFLSFLSIPKSKNDVSHVEELAAPYKKRKEIITNHITTFNGHKISALSLAVCAGSLQAVKLLLNTKLFDKEHIEEAAYLAAASRQHEVLKFLQRNNVNLFKPYTIENGNALHKACITNDSVTLAILLSSNPNDIEIDKIAVIDRDIGKETPYDVTVRLGHTACAQMLQHAPSALFAAKLQAIRDKNIDEFKQLVEKDVRPNPFDSYYAKRHMNLLNFSLVFVCKDEDYRVIHDQLISYLCTFPLNVRINTLISCLFEFSQNQVEMNGLGHVDKQKIEYEKSKLFEILESMSSNYNEVTDLSIHGLRLNDSVFSTIQTIMSESQPRTIDLTNTEYSASENKLLNFDSDKVVPFVAHCLTNRNLISCDLLTTSVNEPVRKLLALILERNHFMQAQVSDVLKDKIYDEYVPKINAVIEEIQANRSIVNKSELTPIKSGVVSLFGQCALFIAKDMKDRKVVKYSPTNNIAEINEVIDNASKSISLFKRTYCEINLSENDKKEASVFVPVSKYK